MSEDYRVDVPKSFIQPNENNLPPIVGISMVSVGEETIVERPIRDRNPGLVSGLWSVILSIFPLLFVIGLPLSIMSVSKSRKASRSSALGVIGFLLNILALLGTAFIVVLFLGLIDGLSTVCSSLVEGTNIVLPNGEQLVCPA